MKSKLRIYMQSIAVLLVLTLLFSLVFAALYYFNAINTKTFHTLNWIGGIIAFGVGGAALGMGINKKALLHAFPVVVLLWIPTLILSGFTMMILIEMLSKSLAYLFGCFLTFTRRKA